MASSISNSLSWDTQSIRQIAEVGPGLCFSLPTFFLLSVWCQRKDTYNALLLSNRSVPLGGWSELYLPCIFLLGLKFCYEFISRTAKCFPHWLWNSLANLAHEPTKQEFDWASFFILFASKAQEQSYFGYAWDYCRVGCGGQSSASRMPEVVASHLWTWHKCSSTWC